MPLSSAVEYRFDPSLYSQLFYDGNMQLSRDGSEIKSFGLDLAPELNFQMRSDRWQINVDTRLNFIRVEDDVFDTDDQMMSVRMTRSSPLTIFQVDISERRASNRTTDFESLGEFDFRNERTERQTLSPVFQWILSPKNRLVFGATVQNMHYDALVYDDYDYNGLNVGWTHYLSEKLVLELTGNATKFDSQAAQTLSRSSPACFSPFGAQDLSDFQSDTVGLTMGMRRQHSERLNYRASVGRTNTDTAAIQTQCGLIFGIFPFFVQEERQASSSSLVVDLGVTYRGEKYTVDATISRALVPAGLGFLTQRDDLSTTFNYQLTEKLRANFTALAYDSSAVDETSLFERKGVVLRPSLRWRLLERWTLDFGASYRTYESNSSRGKRDGTRLHVGLNYAFKPTVVSR